MRVRLPSAPPVPNSSDGPDKIAKIDHWVRRIRSTPLAFLRGSYFGQRIRIQRQPPTLRGSRTASEQSFDQRLALSRNGRTSPVRTGSGSPKGSSTSSGPSFSVPGRTPFCGVLAQFGSYTHSARRSSSDLPGFQNSTGALRIRFPTSAAKSTIKTTVSTPRHARGSISLGDRTAQPAHRACQVRRQRRGPGHAGPALLCPAENERQHPQVGPFTLPQSTPEEWVVGTSAWLEPRTGAARARRTGDPCHSHR